MDMPDYFRDFYKLDIEGHYNIGPGELRRSIRAVQRDQDRTLVIAHRCDVNPCDLLAGMADALPELKCRLKATKLDPRITDGLEARSRRAVEGDPKVETLLLSRTPTSIRPIRPWIIADDVTAIMAGEGGYRLFREEEKGWSVSLHALLPEKTRKSVMALMLVRSRGYMRGMPLEIMFEIFAWASRAIGERDRRGRKRPRL